ncbi:MAG: response regulator [Deltaproteobacteria bacterium]|nr:response regulator [Deltaproteobacteria bacterium]
MAPARMRLLVVEDNAGISENLSEMFSGEFDVTIAPNGKDALAAAEKGFDLAILDVRLPDMSGNTLLKSLKERNPFSEIIVHTGNADLESAIAAVREDAYAYLLKPVRSEELIRTLGHAREQIELRRHSEELRAQLSASEQKLRNIFDTVGAAILAVDQDLRIRFANQSTTQMLGYPSDELIGREVVEALTAPSERGSCHSMLVAVLNGEERAFESACVHKDGSTRLIQWKWTRVRGDPSLDAAYGVGTDVTEQRELERKMRAQERLATAGTLTAGLAHEIRNPLNAAVLQLSLLGRHLKKLPDQHHQKLLGPVDVVRAELKRLDALLEDFLRLARPRTTRTAPVDLDVVIRDVVSLESEAARSRHIALEAGPDSATRVQGDADALKQVLVNLINNALEAAGSVVSVQVIPDDDFVVISVIDDGPGIPKETIDRIFEPFFTTKPTGTGLGLPIVYSIVRSLEGEISLSSDGDGTTAKVRLRRWR